MKKKMLIGLMVVFGLLGFICIIPVIQVNWQLSTGTVEAVTSQVDALFGLFMLSIIFFYTAGRSGAELLDEEW